MMGDDLFAFLTMINGLDKQIVPDGDLAYIEENGTPVPFDVTERNRKAEATPPEQPDKSSAPSSNHNHGGS